MSEDFVAMLRILLEKDVRFLVVGAYAMAAHGLPRATGDIDIWVEPTRDNATRTWDALVAFGAPLRGMTPDDFARSETVFQMGVPPVRIDIMGGVSGVTFSGAWPRRVMVDVDGIDTPFLGPNDLLANKQATGRPKDLLDVETLQRFFRRSSRDERAKGS